MYLALKHFHITCVVLSGAGFALRGTWALAGSPLARACEAPGHGYHWGPEAWHPSLPRGERSKFGAIGTLEEIVELLSWRRLDLHAKPVVFANLDGFWDPLFVLFEHTIKANLTPASFREAWVSVDSIDQIVPALIGTAAAA